MDKSKQVAKYTLITNVAFANMGKLRLEAHAILIVDDPGQKFTSSGYRVRGFKSCGASPVFDLVLEKPSTGFALKEHNSSGNFDMLTSSGEMKPLFAGAVLTVGEVEMFIQSEDTSRPFKIDHFLDITKCWQVLPRRVAEFWTAPCMPQTEFVSAEYVRQGR